MKRYDLSVADVSKILHTTPKTTRSWIEAGELPAFRFRSTWRVSPDDLDEFVARNLVAAVPAT
jgi:excisionase family DNA binding protein